MTGATLFSFLHLTLVAMAAVGVYVWWRRASPDRVVQAMLAAGVLLRLVPGLLLFVVSDFRLPYGRAFQTEPGFWFYALDGEMYYHLASGAAAAGIHGVFAPGPAPSAFYVRVLAATLEIFGTSPASSLALNLGAYVALAAVILAWGRRSGASRGAVLFALAATSFTPSWLLWSYQPLKDSVFLLLVGLFFFVMDRWYTRLASPRWSWAAAAGLFASQVVLIYGLAGIRWYYALIAVCAAPVGLVATMAWQRRPTWWKAVLAVATCVVLAETLVPAAGTDLPRWLLARLRPTSFSALWQWGDAAGSVGTTAQSSLEGSVVAAGATLIQIAPAPGATTDAAQSVLAVPLADRLRATLASLFLPRAMAAPAGHVVIGGGHGLWLFADLDTLMLDATIVAALWLVAGQLSRGAVVHPVFWTVLAGTAATALLLAAIVANFGTLFRLRAMITIGIALLPLTVSAAQAAASATPATDTRPSRY